jgi:hypothetical protein
MLKRYALMALFITACLIFVILPACAEEQVEDVVIYQTNFNSNPDWITNSPRSYYWVPEKGVYHYAIEASTGANAYVEVNYAGGPFKLEYDLTPVSTDQNAATRVAFSSKEMDRTKGPIALTEFTNDKNGRLMWIRAVTPGNKLSDVSSYTFSYGEKSGAPTVRYEDNKTYHVTLDYDNERNMLTMRVTEKLTGKEIWGYFLNLNEELKDMNRIVIGSLGDYSDMGPVAEGYIDNLRLSTQKTVTITTAPTKTPTQVPVTTRTTVKKTATPTTPLPAETTPESPVSPLYPITAAGMAGAAFWYCRHRPNR